jgi:serine/threonine-protein kinase HipA
MAIDLEDRTASLKRALDVADYFELTADEARDLAGQVAVAIAPWKRTARKLGITQAEIERMSTAFEHQDFDQALGYAKP